MDPKGKKILIADDEPDILEIISYNLKIEGYDVVTAKDGEDALQKAKLTKPDLIILDLNLPVLGGLEVAREVHEPQEGRPVRVPDGDDLVVLVAVVADDGLLHLGLPQDAGPDRLESGEGHHAVAQVLVPVPVVVQVEHHDGALTAVVDDRLDLGVGGVDGRVLTGFSRSGR